jgi:hypothetical protein
VLVPDGLEELDHLGSRPGASHRGEFAKELTAVGGLGETGVENGDNASVLRGSDEASHPLSEEHRGAGEIHLDEGVGAALSTSNR